MDTALDDAPKDTERLPTGVWSELADDLRLLGLLHGQELTPALIGALRAEAARDWFALAPAGADHEEGLSLIERGLAALPTPPDAPALDELAAEYAAIYLTHAYRAAPTESVWRDPDGLERQAPMFAVRAFYGRRDLAVADWRKRSDDHIVNELDFLATLLRDASPEALAEAATFLRDHLLVWVPAFTGRVARRCAHPFYAGLALVTTSHLQALASLLGEVTGTDMAPPFDKFVAAAFETTDVTGSLAGAARGV